MANVYVVTEYWSNRADYPEDYAEDSTVIGIALNESIANRIVSDAMSEKIRIAEEFNSANAPRYDTEWTNGEKWNNKWIRFQTSGHESPFYPYSDGKDYFQWSVCKMELIES